MTSHRLHSSGDRERRQCLPFQMPQMGPSSFLRIKVWCANMLLWNTPIFISLKGDGLEALSPCAKTPVTPSAKMGMRPALRMDTYGPYSRPDITHAAVEIEKQTEDKSSLVMSRADLTTSDLG